MSDKSAFDFGYEAGFAAGVRGDLAIPAPNLVHGGDEPDVSYRFAEGAALGHERGLARRCDILMRAAKQIVHARSDDHER